MANDPIWRRLQDCAEKLTAAGRSPFTRRDLIACVQTADPSIRENSINPIIQGITDNLKGGAPGAVGKDILHSVGRGRFVVRENSAAQRLPASRTAVPRAGGGVSDRRDGLSLPRTETELRDALVGLLAPALPGIQLEPEGSVQYRLPSGLSMSHASDILAEAAGSAKRVSIEIKYRSAVTDQFKARAYDAAHMKREHAHRILTVMLFAKSDAGISIDRARDICHEFDRFYGDAAHAFLEPHGLDELARDISGFLRDDIG